MRAHQHAKLIHHSSQHAQPIVLRQRLEEVLDNTLLILGTQVLLQLLDNLLLVGDAQGRRAEHLDELGVLFEERGEALERLGGRVEGVGF